jgi:pimeloyl-ACP methyl ester carboxylesterase
LHFSGCNVQLVGDLWTPPLREEGLVLLLHGGGQTRHSWSRTAKVLAAANWTAIALDMRGHGDSDWAPDGDYSMDSLVADLSGVIGSLWRKPVLVGASMGGMTSLLAEGERGGTACALILVDVVPKLQLVGVKRIIDFMTAYPDGFESLDDVADSLHAYNPHRSRPSDPDGLRKNLRLSADGRWHWHWDPLFLRGTDERVLAERFARARAAATRVTIPTLLVRGTQSDVVDAEGAADLLTLIPHACSVDVPGAGHTVAADSNDSFGQHVLEFLAQISR